MDHAQTQQEVLEQIALSSRRQVRYARLQLAATVILAAALLILALAFLRIFPQLQEVIVQAETVLANLESVTNELAQADLAGMVEGIDELVADVDSLVGTSQVGVEQAMEKINAIDFAALNKAIKDLADVIEPLARVVNKFSFG